jgi:hypothetical protein
MGILVRGYCRAGAFGAVASIMAKAGWFDDRDSIAS